MDPRAHNATAAAVVHVAGDVRFTAVASLIIAIGKARIAGANSAHAVCTYGRAIWRRTFNATSSAVVDITERIYAYSITEDLARATLRRTDPGNTCLACCTFLSAHATIIRITGRICAYPITKDLTWRATANAVDTGLSSVAGIATFAAVCVIILEIHATTMAVGLLIRAGGYAHAM